MHKMPNQPTHIAPDGVRRFVKNRIVDYLLEEGPFDLNHLARISHDFSKEEKAQFAQLIGYSVSGWGSLSYVTDEKYNSVEDEDPAMNMEVIADALEKKGYTYLAEMLHPSRLIGFEHKVASHLMEEVREKTGQPVVAVCRYNRWTAQYPSGGEAWVVLTDSHLTEIHALAAALLDCK